MLNVLKNLTIVLTLLKAGSLYSQVLNTVAYRDISIPRVEANVSHYNFSYPVQKDFYSLSSFTPPIDGRFFVQNYGPRTIANYDNHQGTDIWGYTTTAGITTINPPAICMCDGVIEYMADGPDSTIELTTSGRTIRIKCDSSSQVFGSQIHIIYRHLDSLINLAVGMQVQKGDTVAFVGSSGTTSLSHLHLDYSGIPNFWNNSSDRKYLNPMRLFDPTIHPHVIGVLNNSHIEILRSWEDSTLIRIHWPHNQHINRFEFTNNNYNIVFDVEEVRASYPVFEPSIWARDSMKIFPYRTNGYRTALYYETQFDYPAIFPNSPSRDTNLALYGFEHIPLTADSVVNVYDFILTDVPANTNVNDWIIKLSDVWGYTVEGTSNTANVESVVVKSDTFTIFPNPVSEQLTIYLDSYEKPVSMQVYNSSGKLVLREQILSTAHTINTSELPSGLYIVAINSHFSNFIKN